MTILNHFWARHDPLSRYDPTDGTLGSVCRVMSGFSDKFYKDMDLHTGLHRVNPTAKSKLDNYLQKIEGPPVRYIHIPQLLVLYSIYFRISLVLAHCLP